MKTDFHNKYSDKIAGTISCLDRVIISGSLTKWGYAESMNYYIHEHNIKVKDFPMFGKQMNDSLRQNVESIAVNNNISIEHIRSPLHFNKEEHIQKILLERGEKEGLIKIYTSMEICDCYRPTFDKIKNRAFLKSGTSKCLYYYIYFIDKSFGLCFLRIPTWIPFRVQFYFNGHNYLANKLRERNINYSMSDNAFNFIDNYNIAQELSSSIKADDIHKSFDGIIKKYIPFLEQSGQTYRWTLSQVEYSTDVIFKNTNDLLLIYDQLVHNCIHSVKPDNIATFFSRKLAAHYQQEVGNKYNKQIQGTRIKHLMGVNSIKMYNKDKNILRIETTVNDVTEFKIYRQVNTIDHRSVQRLAPMKKSIYSLYELCKCCLAANSRYLDFIASFEDNSSGIKNLDTVSQKITDHDRSYRGFNFFEPVDAQILLALESGEFNINGFRNKSLRKKLSDSLSASAVSRILKRLLLHGIIKKVKNTYKYYLTKSGKRILAGAHIVKELYIIPALATS